MFNLNGIGTPVFNIVGGKYNKQTVYVSNERNTNETVDGNNDISLYRDFKALKLSEGHFEINLNIQKNQRLVISLYGMSGSGKTYMLNEIIENMIKSWGSNINKILFFSKKYIEDEKSISDKVKKKKNFHQIKLDDTMILDAYDLSNDSDKEEFKNSITIFDDINTLSVRDKRNKQIRDNVLEIRDDLLEVSRYLNTTVLCTEHLLTSGVQNRALINESSHLILFTNNGMGMFQRYFSNYLGMTQKSIRALNDICKNSRYVIIRKAVPTIYCTETEIGFIKNL